MNRLLMTNVQVNAKRATDPWEHNKIPTTAVALIACMLAVYLVIGAINRSVWYDEAATIAYSVLPWRDFFAAMHKSDAFYAFYYMFMHVWIGLFGTSALAIRMPSIIAIIASVPAVYLFLRRLIGTSAALLCIMLTFANGFYLQYGDEARAYTLFVLATVLTSAVAFRILVDPSRRMWVAYGALNLLAIHLQFFSVFVMCAHIVCYAILGRRRESLIAAGMCFGVIALATPMLWLAMHDANSRNDWMARSNPRQIPALFGTFAHSSLIWKINVGFALAGLIIGLRKQKRAEVIFLATWVCVPIICVMVLGRLRPIFEPKYMLEMFVPYVALTAYGVMQLRKPWHLGASAILLALQVHVLMLGERTCDQDWRDVAMAIEKGPPDAHILVYPQIGYFPLAYYLPQAHERVIFAQPSSIAVDELQAPLSAVHLSGRNLWMIYDSLQHTPEDAELTPGLKLLLSARYHPVENRDFVGIKLVRYVANT